MAVTKTGVMSLHRSSVANFILSSLPIVLLLIPGSWQLPIRVLKSEFSLGGNSQEAREQKVVFNGFMMIPKVYSYESLDKDQSGFIRKFKNHTVDAVYPDGDINIVLLRDGKSYINNVNELEMDNLSRERRDNVSVLQGDRLGNDKGGEHNDLVTWNSAASENGWSVWQLPVFVVLSAIIGGLAIILVTLLWLKNQMIQREKSKKVVVLDGNQIQLSNSTCPSPSLPPEERWICHTVINLKNSAGNNGSSTVSVQPQEPKAALPNVPVGRSEEVERRPETVRIKAKCLLERRGSSASLTIDLPQGGSDSKAHVVTPTRECMNEEYLLSAGNVLSRSQLRSCLQDVPRLHLEFWNIPLNHQEKSVVTGCGAKNRYETILPNEKTRVKLTSSDDQALDAYINANYIRGYDGEEKAYIATQGPLPNTVQDLYKMAWNERSPIIVMITRLCEDKVKCESYFPLEINATATYGGFKVTVIRVEKKEGFSVRELLIQNDRETRSMLHYWCDSWLDHKIPQDAQTIVTMATEIETHRGSFRNKSFNNNGSSGPVIVHCSAGIGRTGCFIAISLAICQLKKEDRVDILGIVCRMRCDRGGMIQTAEQYEFVHRAVAAYEDTLTKDTLDSAFLERFPAISHPGEHAHISGDARKTFI